MFKLDDNFLQDVGLADLPDEEKKAFLQHIYAELELRVGTRLADGLSDDQLTEFEALIEHDENRVVQWLGDHLPNYREQADFQTMFAAIKANSDVTDTDIDLLGEYAATKWLEMNRPDYRQVVADVLAELKQEITSQHDALMAD